MRRRELRFSKVLEKFYQTTGLVPIGNLTSQIFANIYLNEFDRYVKHILKPLTYLRYGDDFIFLAKNRQQLTELKLKAKKFSENHLSLRIDDKNDIIIKAKWGVRFLGSVIYPRGIKLSDRNKKRIKKKLCLKNFFSYYGIIKPYGAKELTRYNWQIIDIM